MDTHTCARCGETKLRSEFSPNPRYRSGLQSYCKDCTRAYQRERSYNLKPGVVEDLFRDQGGICKICQSPLVWGSKGCHVDHDHVTGKVRGLLCPQCNMGLGNFRDDPVRLEAALAYLRVP